MENSPDPVRFGDLSGLKLHDNETSCTLIQLARRQLIPEQWPAD